MEVNSSVTQIIAASRSNPQLLAELERFRRNVAVMFTDIKGSTSYFERHGDIAGLMMVNECNERLRQVVEKHHGHFIKTIGDAIMATFEDCPSAVTSAIEMQRSLAALNASRPAEDRIAIRIGLNYGSGIVKSNDVFGDVVNVASRVESAAHPDQIVISTSVNQILTGGNFSVRHLGRYALKGKDGDFDLFEVLWDDKLAERPAAAHTMLTSIGKASGLPAIRLRHVRRDGSEGTEYPVRSAGLTIGSGEADVRFAGDSLLSPVHARFQRERGQLFVEDLSDGTGVYVRLLGTYTLQTKDIVRMGRQLLEFRAKSEALAAAAATGTAILDLNQILDEPVAEFLAVGPGDSSTRLRFPLAGEETTWGRNRGTYQFPDDPLMSGSHARVYQRGEDYFLEDLGSRNGTFLRVQKKMMVPIGGTVQIGGQIFKVAE